MFLYQAPALPARPPIPPLGPDLIREAVQIVGTLGGIDTRAAFVAAVGERLPTTIGPGSRARFSRYLARPYLDHTVVDRTAVRLLGAPLPQSARKQLALLCLAECEPGLAQFLDECLPEPDWRWFAPGRVRRWVAERRGIDDPTSASRLLGVLKRSGYLRPFDRGWVLEPPAPSASVLVYGMLRQLGAPGQATLSRLFDTRVVTRTLAPTGGVYRMLEWATNHDLVRWAGQGESAIWFPRPLDETIDRLIGRALPEPPLS